VPPTSSPTKQAVFEKDSEQLHINKFKTYFDISLNILESNTKSYCKVIQLMYKMIKEMDNNTLIVKYKGKDEEITESNESGVTVMAKNTLLNFTKVISSFL